VFLQELDGAQELEVRIRLLGKTVSLVFGHQVGTRLTLRTYRLDHLFGLAQGHPGVVLALNHEERHPDPVDLVERRNLFQMGPHPGVALVPVFHPPQIPTVFLGVGEEGDEVGNTHDVYAAT
jgi:hypothetical protein